MVAVVVVHECDVTNDAMWHVPHRLVTFGGL